MYAALLFMHADAFDILFIDMPYADDDMIRFRTASSKLSDY